MSEKQNFVLITGATSGIGYQLARLFAADKYNLVIVARNPDELEMVATELRQDGIEVIPIAKDLFRREEAFALCDEVTNKGIRIDILVNDAGQGVYGLFKDNEIRRELDIIDLNISSVVILTKHFVQGMSARKSGKILNLASIAGTVPGPWQAVYHATKAFVLSFSEALHSELKEAGITVTALLPGITNTDFFDKADMLDSKAVQDKSKMADPADVAKDGYNALMAGKDKVISGLKNKMRVAMSNVTPDKTLADQMKDEQKPAYK